MNRKFTRSVPAGDFAEVSALEQNWQVKLRLFISQKRHIKYDFYPLSGIPEHVQRQLKQEGYQDLIFQPDQWQHFLIPPSNTLPGGDISPSAN